jgi:hypothetical protein
MAEEKTVTWKNMNWKEKLKFILGVLMGVSVKYYEPKTKTEADEKNN